MCISDLISELEKVLKLYGDLNVEGWVGNKEIYLTGVSVPNSNDSPLYLDFSSSFSK